MLAVLKANKTKIYGGEEQDIIVTRRIEKITYDKDGNETRNFSYEKTNLTRKIQETARVIKETQMEEKLKILKEIEKAVKGE